VSQNVEAPHLHLTVTQSDRTVVPRSRVTLGVEIELPPGVQYQGCDKTICYPPASVPLKWQLQILPLDLKRSPKAIQHK
jgi:hypothetical protein